MPSMTYLKNSWASSWWPNLKCFAMTEEERTFTKQQKFWGHNNRVSQNNEMAMKVCPKKGGLLSNSPFNSWEIERRIYQFTKSHLWGSFIPGHPSIISLRTTDVFLVVARSNVVVGYWWSKFTRMAKVWNLGCMTEKKKTTSQSGTG